MDRDDRLTASDDAFRQMPPVNPADVAAWLRTVETDHALRELDGALRWLDTLPILKPEDEDDLLYTIVKAADVMIRTLQLRSDPETMAYVVGVVSAMVSMVFLASEHPTEREARDRVTRYLETHLKHAQRQRSHKRSKQLGRRRIPQSRRRGAPRPRRAAARRAAGVRSGNDPGDDDSGSSTAPSQSGRRTAWTYAVLSPEQRGEASWS